MTDFSAQYAGEYGRNERPSQRAYVAIPLPGFQDAHTAELMTSSVTYVPSQSQNRGESAHFRRCLRRRRRRLPTKEVLPTQSEAVGWQPSSGVLECGNGPETQRTDGSSLATSPGECTSMACPEYAVWIASDRVEVDRNVANANLCRNRKVTVHTRPSTGERCLERVCVEQGSSRATSRGSSVIQRPSFPTDRTVTTRSDEGNSVLALTPVTQDSTRGILRRLSCRCGAAVGQLIRAAESVVDRLLRVWFRVGKGGEIPSQAIGNRVGSVTFHRWVTVLLVCVMVLPLPTTAAPGFHLKGSGEPGYKNSFYEKLPPKAQYESVIICLLAVSAFIGLIVWVLKSNFEERQQKRIRREASLRERTSSVAFLKT